MEIRIDPHTLERAKDRGTNEEEIKDVINTGEAIAEKRGRFGKAKVYDFRRTQRGNYYEQGRVEVIYTIEQDVVITVTVHVFYGGWEKCDADPL